MEGKDGTDVGSKTSSHQNVLEDKPISQKSLDLDDLFGFTEARRKLERVTEDIPEEPTFIPYRIFLNNIDSFLGRHMSQFLSDQVVGELKPQKEDEEEEDEEFEEQEEEDIGEEEGERNWKLKKEKKTSIKNNYELIGTVQDPGYKKTESIKEIITDSSDREEFLPKIMKCGFIIYDITSDKTQIPEALWTLKAIESQLDKLQEEEPKAFKKINDIRHFILISTVMTWALTKPIDPDDPEQPFTETDFRKRKPHPNYKDHIGLEKEVTQTGKKYKDKYKTLVIAAGITYGREEDVLHVLFKMAWQNEPTLPLFLPGKNVIPLIHIMDLTSVLHNVLEEFPSRQRYILAIEMTPSKLRDIIKAISSTLSTGKYKKISKEEAFLIPEITQKLYGMLTVNLTMEPVYIVENMAIKWVSELGFVENIEQIVTEYKEARQLKALRIFLHGPPAVGKTRIAKRLCSYYQLHYLYVADIINNAIKELREKADRIKEEKKEEEATEQGEEEEEEDEEEDDMQENLENAYELLEEIEANMNENNGHLDENYVLRFFKEEMMSNPCQNQGFILDGYPKTTENAKSLFDAADDEEQVEEEEEGELSYNKKIMPEYVISLDTTDEVLFSRVMDLPEKIVQGTKYNEENMIRRVREFRKYNTDEETVLNYFDELEIHPLLIDVTDDNNPYMEKSFKTITDKIGKPRNYGEKLEEDEMTKYAKLITEQEELEEQKRREEVVDKTIKNLQLKMEEWANLLDALKEEEEQLLAIQGIPARHYLMRYVFPTLTRGLLEVAHVRPEDPVDYLAEYLFRENPEGKMFQPDYAEAAEDLINAVQQFRDSLILTNSLTDNDAASTFKPYHRLQQYRHQGRSYSKLSPIGSRGEPAYEPRDEYLRDQQTDETEKAPDNKPEEAEVEKLEEDNPEFDEREQQVFESDQSENEKSELKKLEGNHISDQAEEGESAPDQPEEERNPRDATSNEITS